MSPHGTVLPALILVGLAGSSLLLGISAMRLLAFRRRMRGRAAAVRASAPAPAGPHGLRRGPRLDRGVATGIEGFLATHFDRSGAFRSRIAAAGLAVSLSRILLLAAGAAFILTLLGHALGVSGPMLLLLFGAAFAGLPLLALRLLARRRRARFQMLLPDAIGLMVRGLRAGVPVSETIAEVARELEEPLRSVFRRVHDQVRLGIPLEAALWQEARAFNVSAFDFLIVSLSIQRETGGNLAETLSGLADLVRRRQQMQLKARALTSEARASAIILGSLPAVLALLMALLAPDYLAPLFETKGGHMLLALGAGSLAVGAAVMSALVRLEE